MIVVVNSTVLRHGQSLRTELFCTHCTKAMDTILLSYILGASSIECIAHWKESVTKLLRQ
jgi:hypothetical protein